ncbi:MAG: MOSC domain-containing protein [Isosphaeraceae bacterium]
MARPLARARLAPGAGTEFEFPLFPGTFFDGAPIHIVTTATLLHLAETSPESDFSSPRFRPNFILDTSESLHGFVEDGWLGRRLQLGEVVLRVDRPTPRCVMTTLPQSGLRHDPGVLRTAVRSNGSNVGVYATLVQSGRVFRGDAVRLLDD